MNGKWLIAATILIVTFWIDHEWSRADDFDDRLASASVCGDVRASGVRTNSRIAKNIRSAASNPPCSLPHIGCPPMA